MSSHTASGGPVHEFPTPQLEFLGEQDGSAERQLKEALAALLRRDSRIVTAYLARVRYDGKTPGVILGLKTDGEESEQMVAQIGAIFAAIFNATAHLDVIFLSDEQTIAIRNVCPAFHERTP